jgi:hypothetical protein
MGGNRCNERAGMGETVFRARRARSVASRRSTRPCTRYRPRTRHPVAPFHRPRRRSSVDLHARPHHAMPTHRRVAVLRRVDRCIDENTGRLLEMKNPCIILDNVVCEGAYNVNCPRSIYAFWREIWLERVSEPVA